ncbi:hypothetical protein F5Y14DRAFT_450084 [Nemania sp. NC0429]|nr:hypothetical protein F5Y14DRAFT_450084 [Nemania sp. NC0429]
MASHKKGIADSGVNWVVYAPPTIPPIGDHDTPTATRRAPAFPSDIFTNYGPLCCMVTFGGLYEHHHVLFDPEDVQLRDPTSNHSRRALEVLYRAARRGPDFRIVAGHDGKLRYLLRSVWRYYYNKGADDIRIGDIVCPCSHSGQDFPVRLPHRDAPPRVFDAVLREAIEAGPDGVERTGGCTRCATDFAVRLTPTHLDVQAWQDLTPEDSTPGDHYPDDPERNTEFCGAWVPLRWLTRYYALEADLGSVRKLYEQA